MYLPHGLPLLKVQALYLQPRTLCRYVHAVKELHSLGISNSLTCIPPGLRKHVAKIIVPLPEY